MPVKHMEVMWNSGLEKIPIMMGNKSWIMFLLCYINNTIIETQISESKEVHPTHSKCDNSTRIKNNSFSYKIIFKKVSYINYYIGL